MNNDLEQFSEERLKDMQKHVAAGMALGYADALLIHRVIDIALAAKQAKPVAFTSLRWLETRDKVEAYTAEDLFDEKYAKNGMKSVPLYTTPQPAHTEQDGWKLVPIEPTEAMLDEFDSIIDFGADDSVDAWRRLIAAAPKPESE